MFTQITRNKYKLEMELCLRYKGEIKHKGYTNNTSEGLDGTFYSAFYYIHFKYGLKLIVTEIHSLKTLVY